MTNNEEIADYIETILGSVLADAAALETVPVSYFMLFDQQLNDNWILGFLFQSQEELRAALESGACYQIHVLVHRRIAGSEKLVELRNYIVFDFGSLPSNPESQAEWHQKYVAQLDALAKEAGGGEFVVCELCGHDIDQHQMRGFTNESESAPTGGWMICSNTECSCFRTWDLSTSEVEQ